MTTKDKKTLIWDNVRQLWLVLTPEEWVRQHVLNFLIQEINFSKELLKLEHPVNVGTNTCQRIDILCYNKNAQAQLLVECKAPNVKISQQVLDQAVRYNSVLGAKYIMLTNGLTHYFYQKQDNGEYVSNVDISKINL